MRPVPFVPLRIFSAYTMLEGAIQPKKIAARARELGFPAAALVDRNGLYAAMPFCAAAFETGVQPIIGTMLAVARPGRADGEDPVIDWLPLLAQDETGYENLCALVSEAHLNRPMTEAPHVAFETLDGRTDGLIALTGGGEGALARLFEGEQTDAATAYAGRLITLFPGRLYVEISRRGDSIEEASEDALLDLAYARDIPIVATNPAFFSIRISMPPMTRCCALRTAIMSKATIAARVPKKAGWCRMKQWRNGSAICLRRSPTR